MTMSTSDRRKAFDDERDLHIRSNDNSETAPFIKRGDGWVLFGPRDVRCGNRKYHFALQHLKSGNDLRVRVGCRFYTVETAFRHWDPAKKRGWVSRRNECRQARAIIMLMVFQAQSYGLLSLYNERIKFDLKLKPKPKRK